MKFIIYREIDGNPIYVILDRTNTSWPAALNIQMPTSRSARSMRPIMFGVKT